MEEKEWLTGFLTDASSVAKVGVAAASRMEPLCLANHFAVRASHAISLKLVALRLTGPPFNLHLCTKAYDKNKEQKQHTQVAHSLRHQELPVTRWDLRDRKLLIEDIHSIS